MIVRNYSNASWDFGLEIHEGQTQSSSVFSTPAVRVSAILGPDGEPLEVVYARNAIGFDLRKKGEA